MTGPGSTGAVSEAEHTDRVRRVLSVACGHCLQPPGEPCLDQDWSHAARWDAWYAAHPEAAR